MVEPTKAGMEDSMKKQESDAKKPSTTPDNAAPAAPKPEEKKAPAKTAEKPEKKSTQVDSVMLETLTSAVETVERLEANMKEVGSDIARRELSAVLPKAKEVVEAVRRAITEDR